MPTLKNKKEFIYYLDGKYYIIGDRECKECEDQELIKMYQYYVELTDDDEFQEYDVRTMQKKHRDKVAETYKQIFLTCHVSNERSQITAEKLTKREEIESQYKIEIDKQLKQWIKADTCLSHKETEELVAKMQESGHN